MSRTILLDNFYTKNIVAQTCFNFLKAHVNLVDFDLYVEPSAGSGVFLDLLPLDKRLGMDLVPNHPLVRTQDFLKLDTNKEFNNKRVMVLGNPPFGKNSSLALKFFKKSADFAEIIAFVLPRTFQKESMQSRMPLNFHLVDELVLPLNSFVFDGVECSVPTVFQIWKKLKIFRKNKEMVKTNDFSFVNKVDGDFSFQRVGAMAGKIRLDFLDRSKESHYFIKILNKKINVYEVLRSIDWSEVKYKTAGNPSIGKNELISYYLNALK